MNRTFLTKSLVSLVILTKKGQSKGMFLDIRLTFLTKNYYFLTTVQKSFYATIFQNHQKYWT